MNHTIFIASYITDDGSLLVNLICLPPYPSTKDQIQESQEGNLKVIGFGATDVFRGYGNTIHLWAGVLSLLL